MAGAVYPSLAQARDLAQRGNLIPVYREVLADMETPVSVYRKIARGTYSFLLESVEGGERLARYSFIGTEPRFTVRLHEGVAQLTRASGEVQESSFSDPLVFVRDLLAPYKPVPLPDMPRFQGGAVGYLAYECVRYFEDLAAPERDDLELPDAVLMMADTLVVFDHVKHRMRIVSHADLSGGTSLEDAYQHAVTRIDEVAARLHGSAGQGDAALPLDPLARLSGASLAALARPPKPRLARRPKPWA